MSRKQYQVVTCDRCGKSMPDCVVVVHGDPFSRSGGYITTGTLGGIYSVDYCQPCAARLAKFHKAALGDVPESVLEVGK